MDMADSETSYFVVKCASLDQLKKCIDTGHWAYRPRVNPPQPEELLSEAHRKGCVILIFSVNNQHGWHGFCESKYTGHHKTDDLYDVGISSEDRKSECQTNEDDNWHHFPVLWLQHFVDISINSCLPLSRTEHLTLDDGSPVNQARNWHQTSKESGKKLCELILEYHENLRNKKELAENQKQMMRESFLGAEEETVVSSGDIVKGWRNVIRKVEKDLGKVILACPFGSQRYNCSLPNSDNDIFIVYQAKTTSILGLDPPKQTVKNSDSELVDYTILEMQRYSELLIAGDPKCIETLFINEDSILAMASESWRRLCELRDILLTRTCVDKYLREAQGSRGTKQLEKLHNQKSSLPSPKMDKLGYIVLRLLQNAYDIITKKHLDVYRPSESERQMELLNARKGLLDYPSLMTLIDKYTHVINAGLHNCQELTPDAKCAIQNWLVDCRIQDLKNDKILD